jgi:hypothetical protein
MQTAEALLEIIHERGKRGKHSGLQGLSVCLGDLVVGQDQVACRSSVDRLG